MLLPVATLHLALVNGDGSLHHLDVDLNIPSFVTSSCEQYDGHHRDYAGFLATTRPVGWLQELARLESRSGAEKYLYLTISTKIFCMNYFMI